MEIEMREVTVGEVCDGYDNRGEDGVIGYGGKLDIRPQYQRNFIYNDKQRDEVVRTVKKNFPLNVMYWVIRDDGTFEVMDGQQRTISICDYVHGNFSVDGNYFHSLSEKFRRTILDYKLTVYFCRGDDDEKLDWFKIVNIAGEKLLDQEILNAVYAGRFVNEARAFFSQRKCAAYRLGSDYVKGDPIRQDYLETALKWICDAQGGRSIEEYMSAHKFGDAEELKQYFRDVIAWVKKTFPNTRPKQMKGLPWGILFNVHRDDELDPAQLERDIVRLFKDKEVTDKRGVYEYLLTGDERHLSLRQFDDDIKQEVYERQGGTCNICHKHFRLEEMEADHIDPWSAGGKTIPDNCQMLCKPCNRRKSAK